MFYLHKLTFIKILWYVVTILTLQMMKSRFRMVVCTQLLSDVLLWIVLSSVEGSPQGSSVHGIFQQRILEQVSISYFSGSSQSRDRSCVSWVSCIGRWILYHCATWKPPSKWLIKIIIIVKFCRHLKHHFSHINISATLWDKNYHPSFFIWGTWGTKSCPDHIANYTTSIWAQTVRVKNRFITIVLTHSTQQLNRTYNSSHWL